MRTCRASDLEQPLLNGDAEVEKPPPRPPGAPSMELTETAEESTTQPEARTWGDWFRTSPFVPTACCIFLCFILKVVQQVQLL